MNAHIFSTRTSAVAPAKLMPAGIWPTDSTTLPTR
ncbi:hypothetical protein BJ956_003640 [Arthrobacter psychrochitiniphilus]|nr:hypothetical protein [Arthrobacter psychrochitiniphilus]